MNISFFYLYIYIYIYMNVKKSVKKISKFKTHLTRPTPLTLSIHFCHVYLDHFFRLFFFFSPISTSSDFFFSLTPTHLINPFSPRLASISTLLFFFLFFPPSFTTHLDLFFSLFLHFNFISPILFVVVLMLVSFGFEDGVATC